MLNTVIIQPPLVQLNTPYPSGAYLQSFFKDQYKERNIQGKIKWFDLSNELFHSVFCKKGLAHIFSCSSKRALQIADSMEQEGDGDSAFELRRYVSLSEHWIKWIECIVSILCANNSHLSGREFTHEFIRSAHAPRGARMERYLSKLGRDVGVDDSQILASLALADLADYITMCYDSNFALIRYAERLATSTAKFSDVIKGLKGSILIDFYEPLLKRKLSEFEGQNTLFCVSIPFPGCLESAVFTGEYIKKNFGKNAVVAFGGGYVNTELRTVKEKRLFDYCDFLSYDKGYGSYLQIFGKVQKDLFVKKALDGTQIYNVKYLHNNSFVEPLLKSDEYRKKEIQIVKKTIPDFEGIDFKDYPRLADDNNPMHRIWNDGAWIKAYMAYGCYWHRCAFCDTSLDYVKSFCGTDIDSLYKGLCNQAKKVGVYGIHFVDEACPPVSMQRFALLNSLNTETPLTWWGNIRFEKTFSRDLAELLSYGGLTAVSGGIEIATGNGLDAVNKGTSIENIVSSCCAFKEAGILVHSYMIFGFWNQTEQDLINSMETLRQMFSNGLLDSAFWHKFSLTLHSTVYREYLEGKHPDLKPLPIPEGQFAENDIHFEGEKKSQKYSDSLNTALEYWMHGEKLNKSVETYFPFKMPKPTIESNFVEKLIQKYEQKRDSSYNELPKENQKYIWLGGKPVILCSNEKNHSIVELCWSYMGEMHYFKIEKNIAEQFVELVKKGFAEGILGSIIIKVSGAKLFKFLRGKGLVALL